MTFITLLVAARQTHSELRKIRNLLVDRRFCPRYHVVSVDQALLSFPNTRQQSGRGDVVNDGTTFISDNPWVTISANDANVALKGKQLWRNTCQKVFWHVSPLYCCGLRRAYFALFFLCRGRIEESKNRRIVPDRTPAPTLRGVGKDESAPL